MATKETEAMAVYEAYNAWLASREEVGNATEIMNKAYASYKAVEFKGDEKAAIAAWKAFEIAASRRRARAADSLAAYEAYKVVREL